MLFSQETIIANRGNIGTSVHFTFYSAVQCGTLPIGKMEQAAIYMPIPLPPSSKRGIKHGRGRRAKKKIGRSLCRYGEQERNPFIHRSAAFASDLTLTGMVSDFRLNHRLIDRTFFF